MELLVKTEMLSYIYIYIYIYIYGPTFATLKAVSFHLLHIVSTLNQCRKLSLAELCVNTLLATKVTLIADGI
jgi:hypothetical protein